MAGGDRLELSRLEGIFGRDRELPGLLARLAARLPGEAGVEPLLSTEVWAVVLEEGLEVVEVVAVVEVLEASPQLTGAISGTNWSWLLGRREEVE